ncbi:hypothetical protein Rhein_3431 [Rheinheimera sp. A13L]|uniref:hypothetical protein n=1 Tax=Rheinheimera sp. A13L TaxID=506534 RepID=UPI0002124AC9|nr:hypothetical protein [Rheinheimera sp. A13L]EGM76369.1 hypothetical protein Rhein_3431 [Rheinheimera sp. A13L]
MHKLKMGAFAFSIVISAFCAQASSELKPADQKATADFNNSFIERHQQHANYLHLTEKQYHKALSSYLRLASGGKSNLKTLSSFPEVQEARLYFEQNIELPASLSDKLAEIAKTQRQAYADYLGIPVEKLREFDAFVSSKVDMEQVTADLEQPTITPFSETEVIVVTCDAACVSHAKLNEMYKQIYFANLAMGGGVPQYKSFYVYYPSYPADSAYEEWRYNNYSGAWFRGVVEMCGYEICKK